MTFNSWLAQTNAIVRREGCLVVIAARPGDHWNGFYDRAWSPERMAAAFVDWANEPTTDDGNEVRRIIRQASSKPDRAEQVVQGIVRGELVIRKTTKH